MTIKNEECDQQREYNYEFYKKRLSNKRVGQPSLWDCQTS